MIGMICTVPMCHKNHQVTEFLLLIIHHLFTEVLTQISLRFWLKRIADSMYVFFLKHLDKSNTGNETGEIIFIIIIIKHTETRGKSEISEKLYIRI